jgi:quercetin dioxygenase-like cupin family protein
MAVQRLTVKHAAVLCNPGKQSAQIVWPENAPDAQVTVTRVTMTPGAVSPRHSHARAEQTWIVEQGTATLLLADGRTEQLAAGDVIRTPHGDIHGVENTGTEPLVYLTITTPPEDMTGFYESRADP